MVSTNVRYLKRTFQPYLVHAIAGSLGFVALTYISLLQHSWDPLFQAGWIFLLGPGGWIFLGTRYRIAYSEDAVIMKAAGLQQISIRFCNIAIVQSEVSTERGRPFRRIAIYSAYPIIRRKWIDISPKHFDVRDIQTLLEVIREKRPNLALPTIM